MWFHFRNYYSPCGSLSFELDEFVGALNSSVQNTLLDAIRVAFIRSLKSHVETSSSEGSELASKCPRSSKVLEHALSLANLWFLKGYVFVDWDGKHFWHILNWLRDCVVPSLSDSEC